MKGINRKYEICHVCGVIVEGMLDYSTGRYEVIGNSECGCEAAREIVSSKLGVPYINNPAERGN